MLALGIDLGTTSISAVVINADSGLVLAEKVIANGSWIASPNPWESIQDPIWLRDASLKLLDDLLQRYPSVAAIGLTGQMHGILYLDAQGNPVSPLYTWQDGRGELAYNKHTKWSRRFSELTGFSTATGYGLVTHFYNLHNGLVPTEAAHICTIGDYLGLVLTGETTPTMHASNAASIGAFDLVSGFFDHDALEASGIDPAILPEITQEPQIIGSYRNIPVALALGDHQASFLGAVADPAGSIHINVGTGSQVSVLSSTLPKTGGDFEVRPFVSEDYLLTQAALCGGRAYAVLEEFFRRYMLAAGLPGESQYGVMEKLAEWAIAPESELRVATTFSGTRRNPDLRGSIENIGADNFTPEHLIQGVLNGIAHELYTMYLGIAKHLTHQPKFLVGSGSGLRKNKVLQHLFSEKFGMELHIPPYSEEAAYGVALFAVRALSGLACGGDATI